MISKSKKKKFLEDILNDKELKNWRDRTNEPIKFFKVSKEEFERSRKVSKIQKAN